MKCKNCEAENSIEMKFCANCGEMLGETEHNHQQKKNKRITITICVLLVVIMSGSLVSYLQFNQSKQLKVANNDLLETNNQLKSELTSTRNELDHANEKDSSTYLSNAIAPSGFYANLSRLTYSEPSAVWHFRDFTADLKLIYLDTTSTFETLDVHLIDPKGKNVSSHRFRSKDLAIDSENGYGQSKLSLTMYYSGLYIFQFYLDEKYLNEYTVIVP